MHNHFLNSGRQLGFNRLQSMMLVSGIYFPLALTVSCDRVSREKEKIFSSVISNYGSHALL